MTLAVHQLDLVSAKTSLCADLGVLADSSGWRTSVVAECIRVFLHGRRSRIHSTAIAGAIKRCLQPYFDALSIENVEDRFDVVDCLNNLAASGDIYRLENGYWKACPVRLVQIPNSGDLLVVGGAPSSYLNERYGFQPTSVGHSRIIKRVSIPPDFWDKCGGLVKPSDWTARPTADIDDWTKRELARAEKHLLSGALEGAEDMQVYLPERKFVRLYGRRWVRLMDALERCEYPRLCKASLYGHGRGAEYFIVKMTQAESQSPRFSSTRVGLDEAIRIRYGLDAAAKNPLRNYWSDTVTGEFTLRLFRSWPRAEARILSLGELLPKLNDDSSKRYLFNNKVAPLVEFALNSLRVTISNTN